MANMANLNDSNMADDTSLVIGGLVNIADNLTRKVLAAYKLEVDYDQNLAKLRSFDCLHLEAAATFLGGNPGSKADKTKKYENRTTLADYIIMKLEGLFPCECEGCKEQYCIKLGDNPAFRCFLCQQGSHDCDSMAGTVGTAPGSTWLCMPCKKKNGRIESFMGELDSTDLNLSDTEFEEKISPKAGRSGRKQRKKKPPSDTQRNDDEMETPVGGVSVIQGPENAPSAQDNTGNQKREPRNSSRFKNVCDRYLQRECPHGPTGDILVDGKKCAKDHPKRCRRFSQYGTTRDVGCSKGNKCQYFHPPLCRESERTRVCTDKDCKKTHLKHTRRADQPRSGGTANVGQGNKTERSKKPAKRDTRDTTNVSRTPKNPPAPTQKGGQDEQDFFVVLLESFRDDILQQMKESQETMERRMDRKLDLSLDTLREELRGYTPPRPHSLLLQKTATTPMSYKGVLERFRNSSVSTPVA